MQPIPEPKRFTPQAYSQENSVEPFSTQKLVVALKRTLTDGDRKLRTRKKTPRPEMSMPPTSPTTRDVREAEEGRAGPWLAVSQAVRV